MPCYTVQTMSFVFKAEHADLLTRAIEALGLTTTITTDGRLRLSNGIVLDLKLGKAEIQAGQQADLNALKRAYSMQALKWVAAKNNWQVAKNKPLKGNLIKTYN